MSDNEIIRRDPYYNLKQMLIRSRDEFVSALPKNMCQDKFIRVFMTYLKDNPKLIELSPIVLMSSAMKAAQDGLFMDGHEASIGRSGRYFPMVKGILKKLINTGIVKDYYATVVYENDVFKYSLGDDPRIIHEPHIGKGRGDTVCCYAIIRTNGEGIYREVLNVDEINEIRDSQKNNSRNKNKSDYIDPDSPWSKWWGEMAKKTVLRRICKRLPCSSDDLSILNYDDEDEDYSHDEQQHEPVKKQTKGQLSDEFKDRIILSRNRLKDEERKNNDDPSYEHDDEVYDYVDIVPDIEQKNYNEANMR